MQHPHWPLVPCCLHASLNDVGHYLLRVKLQVVARIQLDSTLQPRQCQVEDKLVAQRVVAPLIQPCYCARHSANEAIKREQGPAVSRKQSGVYDEGIIRFSFKGPQHAFYVRYMPLVEGSQRVFQIHKAAIIPVTTGQHTSLWTAIERVKDGLEVT